MACIVRFSGAVLLTGTLTAAGSEMIGDEEAGRAEPQEAAVEAEPQGLSSGGALVGGVEGFIGVAEGMIGGAGDGTRATEPRNAGVAVEAEPREARVDDPIAAKGLTLGGTLVGGVEGVIGVSEGMIGRGCDFDRATEPRSAGMGLVAAGGVFTRRRGGGGIGSLEKRPGGAETGARGMLALQRVAGAGALLIVVRSTMSCSD